MVDILVDNVKYIIKPYYMMFFVKNSRVVTRPYTKNLDIQYVFEYVKKVAEVVYIIANGTRRNTHDGNALIYRMMRGSDPKVYSAITQIAIRDWVATHKIYRTEAAQGMKVSEPVFRNPVVKLTNQNWRFKPIAGGYMAIANVGSSKHQRLMAIPASSDVVRQIGQNELGELWIMPTKYLIAYHNKVPGVAKPHPHDKSEIIGLLTDVGGTPKDVIGVNINEKNIIIGDKNTIIRFDLSDTIQIIKDAKTEDIHNTHIRTHDDVTHAARTGRRVTHKKEEARREKQRVTYGGRKLYNKLKRRCYNLKRAGKHKSAAEIKTQMDRCILSIQHNHTKSKNAKKRRVTKAMRHHEHVLNVIAIYTAQWAAQSGYLMVLGDLTRISHNWQKGGKFGLSVRRRLHSAMMRKASNLIYKKSRFLGAETLHMHPHNASKMCAGCRTTLTGTHHKKDCTHCRIIGVDRDVNAVENIRQTSAALQYGRQVSASLAKVRRVVYTILYTTPLMYGCWSNRPTDYPAWRCCKITQFCGSSLSDVLV